MKILNPLNMVKDLLLGNKNSQAEGDVSQGNGVEWADEYAAPTDKSIFSFGQDLSEGLEPILPSDFQSESAESQSLEVSAPQSESAEVSIVMARVTDSQCAKETSENAAAVAEADEGIDSPAKRFRKKLDHIVKQGFHRQKDGIEFTDYFGELFSLLQIFIEEDEYELSRKKYLQYIKSRPDYMYEQDEYEPAA